MNVRQVRPDSFIDVVRVQKTRHLWTPQTSGEQDGVEVRFISSTKVHVTDEYRMARPEFKPGEFPDLPGILSREIEVQVFTHRSFFARSAHVFEDHPEDPSPDNEK